MHQAQLPIPIGPFRRGTSAQSAPPPNPLHMTSPTSQYSTCTVGLTTAQDFATHGYALVRDVMGASQCAALADQATRRHAASHTLSGGTRNMLAQPWCAALAQQLRAHPNISACLPADARARAGIGYLPQEASIFRKMTVEENILAILETTVLTEEERVNKMNSLIEEFRIEHIRKSKGTELSGGERRRVEIARALATDPAFILLDEPFAGIDPIAVSDIQGMIAHLAKRGIGILITDHNVRETLSIVDKAYILANGEILIHGDSETIANDPTARKYYLGENFSM